MRIVPDCAERIYREGCITGGRVVMVYRTGPPGRLDWDAEGAFEGTLDQCRRYLKEWRRRSGIADPVRAWRKRGRNRGAGHGNRP